MSFYNSMNISASGLTAERLRMDIISQNIANVDTTRSAEGGPYKRKVVLFEEIQQPFISYFNESMGNTKLKGGIRVTQVIEDNSKGNTVYDPTHPDADADGYVTKPNVNIVTEMVDMISASRAYEANITSMNITKSMLSKTLEISR